MPTFAHRSDNYPNMRKMLVRAGRAAHSGRRFGRRDHFRRYLVSSAERRVVEGLRRHSFTARLAVSGSRSLIHSGPGIDRAVGVRRDQEARINRKLLTTDQSRRSACLNDTLKDVAENVAVTEPVIAELARIPKGPESCLRYLSRKTSGTTGRY